MLIALLTSTNQMVEISKLFALKSSRIRWECSDVEVHRRRIAGGGAACSFPSYTAG